MADLATARTRLGPWGHATQPSGSFVRAAPSVVAPTDIAFAAALDSVITLLAGQNGAVTGAAALDAAIIAVRGTDI